MGNAHASVNQRELPERKIGRTYRTSALLFRRLDCTRISTARDALDLKGTVGFFA
jgi:hypothetical protein